jgi:hypothetical protein
VAFEIQVQYKQVAQGLSETARAQVPFVVARTITALAQDVQAHLKGRLPVAFDRPTPFTQRGVFMRRAEKTRLVAEVYFPESQEAQGKSQREYIRPGAEGASARRQKKTEFLLTRAGYLPAGWVTTPGRFIADGKLDQFGNMPGRLYAQIIRNLQVKYSALKPVSAASQKRAVRMGVENEFFAVAPGTNRLAAGGGWLPPGVYKREGRGGRTLRQYLKFVRKASYRRRLDVETEAAKAVKDNLQRRWGESLQLITSKFNAR